jgi:hypothetical protein
MLPPRIATKKKFVCCFIASVAPDSGHSIAVAHGPSNCDHGIGAGIKDTATWTSPQGKIKFSPSQSWLGEAGAGLPKSFANHLLINEGFAEAPSKIGAASGSLAEEVATMAMAGLDKTSDSELLMTTASLAERYGR